MTNERVEVLPVSMTEPSIVNFFAMAGEGKIAPLAGVLIYRIGENRFSMVRISSTGGRITHLLEIVEGVLRFVSN